MAVVSAVSAVDGRRPRDMRPLTAVIDPDALDALFESRGDGSPKVGGRVTFVYEDCRVTVDNGEFICLRPLEHRSHTPVDPEPCRPRGE